MASDNLVGLILSIEDNSLKLWTTEEIVQKMKRNQVYFLSKSRLNIFKKTNNAGIILNKNKSLTKNWYAQILNLFQRYLP